MSLPSGIESQSLDDTVRPQDDLFRFVNGRWLDATPIPDDRARYGTFIQLREEAEQATRSIVEAAVHAPAGTAERKVGDLFTSFMDTARIDAAGADPLAPWFADADAAESVPALLSMIGSNARAGGPDLFQFYVDNDPGDPERYIVMLEQGGISLPDESYYREERFAEVRAQHRAHIGRMFELAGFDETDARAARVVELETALAAAHWDNVRTRDSSLTYNLRSWAEVAAQASVHGVDLGIWRAEFGAHAAALDEVVLREPDYVDGLAAQLTADRLGHWRDWYRWHVLHDLAPYLPDPFVDEHFAFYGKALTGTPAIRERWKRGVSLVESALGEAVGQQYVEQYFPPNAKSDMDALVAHLIAAYRDSIGTLDWMGAQTKRRALEKVEKFAAKIGYPVKWRDYTALEISPTDLIANVRAVSAFTFDRELGKIGRPIDRDEWFMTPQTVNAYYNPGFNEIVFPAAILQPPFYSVDRDAAANFGAIGAIIGHEISHGFDDQGSKFDGDGRLVDWWTNDDRAAFERKSQALIAQYDGLSPLAAPDAKVNGALTIGENIADVSGLAIAWKAYLLSLGGAEPPTIDGLTAAQRFFMSWARAWREKSRPEEARRLVAIDPHSPPEVRCNQVVRNQATFYDAFTVKQGDALWMNPDERVSIW